MSQNLDATAINQIHALISAQGVNEIISKICADAVALPENFRIHDLEKFNLNRFRFRGALSTASIDDFTRYSKDLADEGTRCFIDADNMRAVSVLNLGNGEGWLIGWRSLWYTWGQKETGEWQWTFQVGDLENVNITHWAVMPKAPEAGA